MPPHAAPPAAVETLRVGEEFMMHFGDPSLGDRPQVGRLQRLGHDGSLCIGLADSLRLRRGTPVEVCSVQGAAAECSFASEILGTGHLEGNLPVVLVKAPEAIRWSQHREAFRIAVALHAVLEWVPLHGRPAHCSGLVTELSGTGAQIHLPGWSAPHGETHLTVVLPDAFVDENLRQRGLKPQIGMGRTPKVENAWRRAADDLRQRFAKITAHVVRTALPDPTSARPFRVVTLAFASPCEDVYRLVRHLEREAARRGVNPDGPRPVATAA